MPQIQSVGIVGHGAIGSALGHLFESAQLRVQYFDPEPSKSTVTDIKELVAGTNLIIICAPSWANRQIAGQIHEAQASNTPADQLVVSVAKGVEKGFVTVDRILADELGGHDWGILYGPMIADELAANKHGGAILALSNSRWESLQLAGSNLKLIFSEDTISIALCGVLKNIYAVALGINDGLRMGMNFKGMLVVQILKEMRAIVTSLGGKAESVDSIAGLGDLLATGWSDQSFNHRIGKAVAEGLVTDKANGEGINAIREIGGVLDPSDYPVLGALTKIVVEGASPLIIGASIG